MGWPVARLGDKEMSGVEKAPVRLVTPGEAIGLLLVHEQEQGPS